MPLVQVSELAELSEDQLQEAGASTEQAQQLRDNAAQHAAAVAAAAVPVQPRALLAAPVAQVLKFSGLAR